MIETGERTITKEFPIGNINWKFNIYSNPGSTGRYMVDATAKDQAPLTFLVVRTTTGKWIIHGEGIPDEIKRNDRFLEEVLREMSLI